MRFFTLPPKKQKAKEKEKKHNPTLSSLTSTSLSSLSSNFIIITSKTPKKLSLLAAGLYIFYHFCSNADQILILLMLLRQNQT